MNRIGFSSYPCTNLIVIYFKIFFNLMGYMTVIILSILCHSILSFKINPMLNFLKHAARVKVSNFPCGLPQPRVVEWNELKILSKEDDWAQLETRKVR